LKLSDILDVRTVKLLVGVIWQKTFLRSIFMR